MEKPRHFEESEIWYLLHIIADVGAQFHQNGTKVGDIRPENVFINEDGQIKLASKFSWPLENDNYAKAFHEKEPTFLSPEEVKDLQTGRNQTIADIGKAEAYSTGLTVLDAILLSNSEKLYDKDGNIDYEELQGKKENLKN